MAHIQKEHADKGEDITDTYSRKDTIMRKTTASISAEDGIEVEALPPPPKKAPVPLLPKILPSSQDIRYYKVPPSTQMEGLKVQKAYSLVTPANKSFTIVSKPNLQPLPPQKPKFVVLPAKQPYTIVQNKTYSRKDQLENVSTPQIAYKVTGYKVAIYEVILS